MSVSAYETKLNKTLDDLQSLKEVLQELQRLKDKNLSLAYFVEVLQRDNKLLLSRVKKIDEDIVKGATEQEALLLDKIRQLQSDFSDMYDAHRTTFRRCVKCNHLREQGLICPSCGNN
jgi:hypothetical protein